MKSTNVHVVLQEKSIYIGGQLRIRAQFDDFQKLYSSAGVMDMCVTLGEEGGEHDAHCSGSYFCP